MNTIEDRHLIDRYLKGELSGIELENFRQRLQGDESFRRTVEIQELIYSGIKSAQKERLENLILTSLKYRKPQIPVALKLIVTFLIVTVIGITFWFYVGNEGGDINQTKSWFAFLRSKSNEEIKVEEKKSKEVKAKSVTEVDTVLQTTETSEPVADSSESNTQDAPLKDSVANNSPEDNIVVKQDQLLISTTLHVEDKTDTSQSGTTESLANEAVQHLNPAADLPEVQKTPSDLTVEFWVSPINYRGYKMSKNKLVLFGIEEPDDVKLYRVDNALYMTYLREYYRLTDTFEFLSYQKLKEGEIPLAIK